MVDRAFALEARAALHRFADDASQGPGGAGGDIISRAEHRHRRNTEGRSDMHGPRVIREVNPAGRGQIDELGK